MQIRGRTTNNSSSERNQLSYVTNYVLNKMFPGSQRNCTTLDSMALTDSNTISKAVNYDIISANLLVGTAKALD